MAVKVILKQDVDNLGNAGDVKQVAPGYFRNFLLPRGLAVEATKAHLKALEVSAASHATRSSKAQAQSQVLADRIGALIISIPVKMGEQGRIHGSVTNKDISEALAAQAEMTVDRHDIELKEPLRSIGDHLVTLKLEHGVDAQLHVNLVPLDE
jgi:large subunit ribosomal protein L9